MKHLLLTMLVMLTVACGGEPFTVGNFTDGSAGEGGELAVAGTGGTSATGGSGGSSAAGKGGSATAGSSSGGAPGAGTGGTGAACEGEPILELPTTMTFGPWEAQDETTCATLQAPLTCVITWGAIEILTDTTFRARLDSVDCGTAHFVNGFCGSEDYACDADFVTGPSYHWLDFEIEKQATEYAVSQLDFPDYIGIEGEEECKEGATTGPVNWPGTAIGDLNRQFRVLLRATVFSCAEN